MDSSNIKIEVIMKKIYIIPELKSVELKIHHQMLSGSPVEQGFNKSGASTLDSGISSGNMGRGGWFDEGEE